MLLIIHLHLLLKMLTAPVANAAVLTVTLLHHDRAPLRRHARHLTHTDTLPLEKLIKSDEMFSVAQLHRRLGAQHPRPPPARRAPRRS